MKSTQGVCLRAQAVKRADDYRVFRELVFLNDELLETFLLLFPELFAAAINTLLVMWLVEHFNAIAFSMPKESAF